MQVDSCPSGTIYVVYLKKYVSHKCGTNVSHKKCGKY